jgi:hypothetical protein
VKHFCHRLQLPRLSGEGAGSHPFKCPSKSDDQARTGMHVQEKP